MSVIYALDVKLIDKYDNEKMSQIIKRGMEIGFIFYDHICGERYTDSPVLNVEGAMKKMLNYSEEITWDGEPNIYTKFQDTYFYFWVGKSEEGFLVVHLGGINFPWKKDFWNGAVDHGFDFARYLRLLLKLCEDFTIVEVRTSAD